MDIARWALGEAGLPRRTRSIGGRLGYDDDGNTPNTQIVLHDYAAAPLLFEVRGLPHDEAAQHADWGKGMDSYRAARIGVIVHCEGGYLRIPDYTRAIACDRDGREIGRFEGATDHFANFVDAVRSRSASALHADIEQGHVSSALCHLGNLSHLLGETRELAAVRQACGRDADFDEACGRMVAHLQANAVDLDAAPLRLGAWIERDDAGEFCGPVAAAARNLAKGAYRAGFAVPDEV